MKPARIEQHHVYAIRALRQRAWHFSRNKNLTEAHRRECKAEAKVYAEIENFLEAHVEDARRTRSGHGDRASEPSRSRGLEGTGKNVPHEAPEAE